MAGGQGDRQAAPAAGGRHSEIRRVAASGCGRGRRSQGAHLPDHRAGPGDGPHRLGGQGRDRSHADQLLDELTPEQRSSIEAVATDMAVGFRNALDKIKVIKRQAYGFRDDAYFILKIKGRLPRCVATRSAMNRNSTVPFTWKRVRVRERRIGRAADARADGPARLPRHSSSRTCATRATARV
jgi:hypothetical protein